MATNFVFRRIIIVTCVISNYKLTSGNLKLNQVFRCFFFLEEEGKNIDFDFTRIMLFNKNKFINNCFAIKFNLKTVTKIYSQLN